jgi:CHASE2 domain-containing sensor protein
MGEAFGQIIYRFYSRFFARMLRPYPDSCLNYLVLEGKKMSKFVILEVLNADSEQRYPVNLRIGDRINSTIIQSRGYFPSAKDLREKYDKLQKDRKDSGFGFYRKLEHIPDKAQVTIISVKESANSVKIAVDDWLNDGDIRFRPVRDKLLQVLSANRGDVRLMIQTDDVDLWGFPWHLWDVLDDFKVEPIFSRLTNKEFDSQRINPKNKVRILAILGDSTKIDVQADLILLKESIAYNDAEIETLVATNSTNLNEQLWVRNWDIIFFAGHSSSNPDYSQGKLAISETETITIADLKNGLANAIKHGLKLVIFNSCDGMGLVNELASLQIPAVIAMRERVPDQVAQKFLEYFLEAFAKENKCLRDSVRKARERLHGMEGEYPCASWLPMIYEDPSVEPPTWIELLKGNEEERQRVSIWPSLRAVLMISLLVTGVVMGLRWVGLLEILELPAYDYLMRQREAETIDPRMTVVEITQDDVDKYGGYPLRDSVLAKLLKKVGEYKPAAVGLAMHRNQARIKDKNDLNARKNWLNLFNKNKNFYIVCSYESPAGDNAPPPEFSSKQLTEQVGFSDFINDDIPAGSNVVRRHLLSYNTSYLGYSSGCITPFSFSFLLAFQFLEYYDLMKSEITKSTNEWRLGDVVFNRLSSRTGGYQKLDGKSSQILLNYRANPKPAKIVSLTDIFDRQFSENLIKDRVIIIGYTASVARDDVNTPYGKMQGVWIHAQMTSQILSAVIDNRPLLWVLPQWGDIQWGDALFVWVWAFTGGIVAICFRSSLYLTISSSADMLLLHQICLAMLNQSGWMPLVPSALALVFTGGALIIYKLVQNRQQP